MVCYTSRGSWYPVPERSLSIFEISPPPSLLRQSKPPEVKFQSCRAGQVRMDLCDREVCARKPPWRGLEHFQITCINRKFRWEEKSAFSRLHYSTEITTPIAISKYCKMKLTELKRLGYWEWHQPFTKRKLALARGAPTNSWGSWRTGRRFWATDGHRKWKFLTSGQWCLPDF